MKKYYSFAGIDLELQLPDGIPYSDGRSLAPFAVDCVEEPHRFTYEMVDTLEPPVGSIIMQAPAFRVYREGEWSVRYIGTVSQSWESAYIRAAHRGQEHHVQLKASQFPGSMSGKTVLNSISAEHLVAQEGGFVFHSSYIEWQGRGILFTAPSETGKSTQAALWERLRGAEVINGDRSVVRLTDEGVFVCGIPFAGSSQICKNRTLPLQAIVYLKQAPQTTIRRLRGAESFRRIWEGCSVNTWDKDDVSKVSETVQQVLLSIPVYELACTPDESAIIALEGVLMG